MDDVTVVEVDSGETVIFVDLAGFTALIEVHGDNHAADLAEAFADMVRASLAVDDHLVKTIGDAVLLTSETPAHGVELVTEIYRRSRTNPSLLDLRAGVHHGPVIHRRGDVFGSTVNVAARVTAMAAGGQVLCTAAVAAAARAQGTPVVDLGPTSLRNVARPLSLYALDVSGSRPGVVDPVCRMRVRVQDAVGVLHHAGRQYAFCSLDCAHLFSSDPLRYAATL